MIGFLLDLDPDLPWHVSRYYPQYHTNLPPTETRVVEAALQKAREAGLRYLYAGNVGGVDWSDTRCPDCDAVLISRRGYSARAAGIENGRCRACGKEIAGVWE